MQTIRANGIAFSVTKSAYVVRSVLKFETEELTDYCYSTEYEAISRSLEHYFTFEVSTKHENEVPPIEAISTKFQEAATEHFKF